MAAEPRPLVTIGIPVDQAGEVAGRALRSALTQSWRPLEILVVEDGSTDGSADRLVDVAGRGVARDGPTVGQVPSVRLVRHASNLGIGAARQSIITHAQGDVIAFFDQDDVSHRQHIEQQVAWLVAHDQRFGPNTPALCQTEVLRIRPDGRRRLIPTFGTELEQGGLGGEAPPHHLLNGGSTGMQGRGAGTGSQLAWRHTYERLEGFDARFRRLENTELNVGLALAGGALIGVATPLVTQYVTPAGHKTWALEAHMHRLLLAKHREAFTSPAAAAFARRWGEARYAWFRGQRLAALGHLAVAGLLAPRSWVGRARRATRSVRDKSRVSRP